MDPEDSSPSQLNVTVTQAQASGIHATSKNVAL